MQSRKRSNKTSIIQQSQIIPQTHSQISYPPIHKHYQSTINRNKIKFTYSSQPSPTFTIKILQLQQSSVLQIQLTKEILSQMDATVLATFDNVQGMYNQFVEIVKTQPEHFQIFQNGMIKVQITVSMKSGVKNKQLVLQTQRRQMTQIQKYRQETLKRQQINDKRYKQIEKQLLQCRQENKQLKNIVRQLKKQLKLEVQEIKQKIEKQRTTTQEILKQLRESVQQIKFSIANFQYTLKDLSIRGKKIYLRADKKSKCFQPVHKQNGYKIQNMVDGDKKFTKITKIGAQKWVQLIFENSIKQSVSFFDIQIEKTKKNYICVGVCSKDCIDQQDCKWSKNAITLFLLDKSIIAQGISMQNKARTKIEANKSGYLSILSNKSYESIKSNQNTIKSNSIQIRVVMNCQIETIQWFQNRQKIGSTNFSQNFKNMCINNEVRPVIICADQDDSIILK